MSLFITFEGGEGSGKSTQSRLLYNRLRKLAIPAVLTHEPGVTELGKRINRLLKWAKNVEISPVAELMLFNVSRAQLIEEVIKPELSQGRIVICDRYADSTTVYQGYGRGLDMDMVTAINNSATGGLKPDLTILLDIPGEDAFKRKAADKPDRFESESKIFHRKVRDGYLEIARQEPERWVIINAVQDRKTIADTVWRNVSRMIADKD
jgi:dTMP kinase